MLPSRLCEDSACFAHKRFDREQSLTAKDINFDGTSVAHEDRELLTARDQLTVTFGTGEISGVAVNDNICLGETICAPGSFVTATKETAEPFGRFQFDGVLGLALDEMSQGKDFNMIGRLAREKVLEKPMFSVFLSDSDHEQSEITFGDYKRDHMASELIWSPVSRHSGYWQVGVDDITVNNERQSLCGHGGCQVAVDTGTSQLAGPTEIVNKLREALDVQPDCSNYSKLPRLGFLLQGQILNLDPSDYVDRDESNGSCEVALMNIDVPPPNGPLFIFGDPFLRKFYTVYDREKLRVGFAAARHKGAGEGEYYGADSVVSLVEIEKQREGNRHSATAADGTTTTSDEEETRTNRHAEDSSNEASSKDAEDLRPNSNTDSAKASKAMLLQAKARVQRAALEKRKEAKLERDLAFLEDEMEGIGL
ncbi:unnamed protein product [Amoebophrya sp. A25]|nr:unnamed protein product [Amoebophrya sp. A25]|eukprot:GSA25T00022011001.1